MNWPCVTDRTSLVGLRPLIRARPRDWHVVIRDGAQPRWSVPQEPATIAEVLRSGSVLSLMPAHAGDVGRLRRARAGATRLVEAVGDRAMQGVDDAFIECLRADLTDETSPVLGKPLAASTASRTLTVLREAARAWATGCGVPVEVDPLPRGPTRRVGARKDRPVPTLYEIGDLLVVAAEPLRAAIGLAVGAGLTEGEILTLRRGQVHVAERRVVLFAIVPGSPWDQRRVRYAWLPPWAMALLTALHPRLRATQAGGYLFPSPSRWDRPRSGFQAALGRACAEAWGDDGPRYTLGDLRRSWQSLCRAHAMPRSIVRHSWWVWAPDQAQSPALPEGAHALRRLMAGWKALGNGTGKALIDPMPVPKQAPKGTKPWEPEPLGARPPAELPASCVV